MELSEAGKVRFSVAFADSPTGPFVKDQPTDIPAERLQVQHGGRRPVYLVTTSRRISTMPSPAMSSVSLPATVVDWRCFQSDDAINWGPVEHPQVVPMHLQWADGTVLDKAASHVERPFLYFDNKGKPLLLFGAMAEKQNGIERAHSFNVRIPFRY
jgi:hypothetical protein